MITYTKREPHKTSKHPTEANVCDLTLPAGLTGAVNNKVADVADKAGRVRLVQTIIFLDIADRWPLMDRIIAPIVDHLDGLREELREGAFRGDVSVGRGTDPTLQCTVKI